MSLTAYGQKQFDLEIGTSRNHVYDPVKFDIGVLQDVKDQFEFNLFAGDLTALSSSYTVSQYYLDLTRHEFYGKHKRTELAAGLGLSMTFRDRNVASSFNELVRKEVISEEPDFVQFKSSEKVWINLYDRYNAVGMSSKLVARMHISQRLSANMALITGIGLPFTNEFLAMVTTVRKDEWTSDDSYSYTESKGIETQTIQKPGQWHVAINGRSGLSYKLLDSRKYFLELGLSYGVRKFFRYQSDQTERYYSPFVGFRAYL